MKFAKKMGVAFVATAAMCATAVVAAAPALADPTVPASAITNDPNASNGSLAFYDTSGNVITSGSSLTHLFDYAAASTPATRTGITKATIFFAFPDHTQADSQNWFSYQATTAATFPNASNPAPLNTDPNPVAHAASNEADLGDSLPTTTQDQTAGYKGILQVRLYDTGPGKGTTTNFWATDIYYDAAAGTWQQVFPAVAQSTTTQLSASPSGGATPGSTVTLTATVSPSAAAGTVQFKDGANNIGSAVAVSSGSAQTTTTTLSSGSHSLTADFTPTDSSAYTGSTSNTVTYVIADVPGAPTGVAASPGHATATVSWTAPADNGGSAITGYDVQYSSDNGATWKSASSAFHTSTATSHSVTGLTNGTSYIFEVAAINAVGKGAYSSPSSAVTPSADGSSLSIGKSVTISYGKGAVVAGTLTDTTTHKAAANQTVVIYHRANSKAAWVKGTSQKTGSTGKVSFTLKPTARTLYQLRFAGSNAMKAATSGTETVSVNQVVSISLTPGSIAHGKTFAVWGGVSPSAAGRKVTLQHKVGTVFKTVTSVTTKSQRLPNGKTGIGYVFHVSQKAKGSYVYRVVVAATSTLGGATSGSVTEHVT